MSNDNIICNCYGVTAEDIKLAIKNGATSFDEVQEITGVATACGVCLDTAKNLVERLLKGDE